jgi:hypothetical protein
VASDHRNRLPGGHDLWIRGVGHLLCSLAEYNNIYKFSSHLKIECPCKQDGGVGKTKTRHGR